MVQLFVSCQLIRFTSPLHRLCKSLHEYQTYQSRWHWSLFGMYDLKATSYSINISFILPTTTITLSCIGAGIRKFIFSENCEKFMDMALRYCRNVKHCFLFSKALSKCTTTNHFVFKCVAFALCT